MMIDLLFQFGISNVCIACLLATLAFAVGKKAKRPNLAHLLWLLVFVKLVTPPVWNVPVELVSTDSNRTALVEHVNTEPVIDISAISSDVDSISENGSPFFQDTNAFVLALWTTAKPWLGWIWIVGTLSIVCISLHRVFHFQRLLKRSTKRAPDNMFRVAAQMAQQLGRQPLPNIVTTSANISPLVWWVGGKVQIVLPQSIINELSADQWRWVLAHELAHVKRRDYLVRWLEWLACATYWWNPLVWWAQHNLRATEEICCDELVLSSLNPNARSYANSILKTVESLVSPVIRPPAMASEINSGGFLQRRIEMIMSRNKNQQTSRGLQFLVVSLALFVMPFGIMNAQDVDKTQEKKDRVVDQNQEVADLKMQLAEIEMQLLGDRLKEAVEAGTMTGEEAECKLVEIHEKLQSVEEDLALPASEVERRNLGTSLKEAVAAGTMTKEEASAAWNEFSQQHNNGTYEDPDGQLEMEQHKRAVGLDIRKAVADGKMTPEEGRAHYLAFLEEFKSRQESHHLGLMLKKALENGEMTAEDARKKHHSFMAELKEAKAQEKYHNAELKIHEMIKSGKITEEQAHERLADLKEHVLPTAKEDDRKAKYQKVEAELNKMVEYGKLTREQADERLAGLKQKPWGDQDSDKKEFDIEVIGLKIKAAVQSGDMTPEVGREKMRAIREKLNLEK